MIKPSELRLGNYVKDRGGKVLKIDFLEYVREGYDCKFGQLMFIQDEEVHPLTEYTDHAEPIELTEDWLIKLGFEEDEMLYRMKYNEYDIKLLFYDCWRLMIDSRFEQVTLTGFWNVHELQNLIFAITDKELCN